MSAPRPPEDAPGVERLLALSDGVVAIALTLLVLSLHVPGIHTATSASQLAHELRLTLTDPLISYVVSFYVIAQFWLAHHRTFRMMTGHDEVLATWNFAFLFTITILPFTSDLLGKYPLNPLAVDIFAFNIVLSSLSTLGVTLIAKHRKLLHAWVRPSQLRIGWYRSVGISSVFAVSMVVAWHSPDDAKYLWLLIFFVPRLTQKIGRRLRPGDDEPALA